MEFQGAQAMGTSKEMFVSRLVGDRDCASMTSSVPTDRHPKSLKIIQPEESEIKSSLPSPSVDSKILQDNGMKDVGRKTIIGSQVTEEVVDKCHKKISNYANEWILILSKLDLTKPQSRIIDRILHNFK
ncbi:hypothetical protein PCASD_08065 [Puccinia coronata f. sp. avenae]|uniref:Uncharacterized protein n=2 Tax=Puccinia coronata f. sp. avenae TaxID=200324 RepID=A0A2N5UZQ5_9BASI|nr:hypothetical protein PCASD_08065 [Puccinia coronata f. sp. avenae]